MSESFSNNTAKNRFEYQVENHTVFANYRKKDNLVYIEYVEAPPELRGSGAAGKLMEYIVQTAKQEDFKITPVCGYAASWLRRHPEYDDLIL